MKENVAPDVVLAGPPDLREGGEGDRQPDLGITIRSSRGSRCAPRHLVLCGTYMPLRQEYAALVTCDVHVA